MNVGRGSDVLNFDPHFLKFSPNPYPKYLIGQNFGGQNFRRTKFFGGQNFRHQVEISAVLSDEIFSSVSYFSIQFTRKICFKMKFVLIWHVLYFSGQNISADKIFGGQNFSADKIFGSKSDFRQFCPPKFCPIRYSFIDILFFIAWNIFNMEYIHLNKLW